MRVGDIVKLTDGSYHCTLVKGVLGEYPSIALQGDRYRVLAIGGVYPTNDGTHINAPVNNVMLAYTNDPNFVVFTQEEFCRVVTPPHPCPPEPMEVVVPHGTKQVHITIK